MSFIPCAFSVAAVVKTMNSAMTFEKPMPTSVSSWIRASSRGACSGASTRGFASGSSFSSSTSSAGLPEEEVGADRRAENGDHDSEIGPGEFEMRQDKIARDGQPGHADHKHRRHIGEERQRQPPQHRGIARVAREHFEDDGDDGKAGNVENGRAGEEQAQRGGHRAKVGADIDRVGDEQQADQRDRAPAPDSDGACFRRGRAR